MSTDAVIVGGGVAGLTAATYTARAGVDTTVVTDGESTLARNAHLENVLGFPRGVNARTFLELCVEGAQEAGAAFTEGRVARVEPTADGFVVETTDGTSFTADAVVAASWSDASYLADIDGVGFLDRGSKTFIDADETGRTGVDGLYAAGRLAEQPHQTIICAGHGATAALALIHDADIPYYHDWVTPEGYFTERGRDVPPGCVEIPADERRDREARANERMREVFEEPQPDGPTMHPSVIAAREDDGEH